MPADMHVCARVCAYATARTGLPHEVHAHGGTASRVSVSFNVVAATEPKLQRVLQANLAGLCPQSMAYGPLAWPVALQHGLWPYSMAYGLAAGSMALEHGPWPYSMAQWP